MSAARDRVQIAIAVVERDGKYLIGLRAGDVPLAGLWEFPGGKIKPGETAETAAVRECLEETAVAVRITGSYPAATFDYPHAHVQLHFLACEPVAHERPLPARFRWVAAAELSGYQFPPANAELLRLLSNPQARR